jgi:hypothetical protein
MKFAFFNPTVVAVDDVPAELYTNFKSQVDYAHHQSQFNDAGNSNISVRGGQQIQIYPNQLGMDVTWLVGWLETMCQGYMELITAQSGTEELKYCKPVIVSIWTIKQFEGDYQEMHTHPGGNISGNIGVTCHVTANRLSR